MRVGRKSQGQDLPGKVCVMRHGHGKKSRRAAARAEKALETKVRQAGRKACREDWT